MKLDLPYLGETYVYDMDGLTLAEAMSVKAISGHNAGTFGAAIFDIDPAAWLAMLVVAMRRAGKKVKVDDIDQDAIDMVRWGELLVATSQAEMARAKAAAQEAVPT